MHDIEQADLSDLYADTEAAVPLQNFDHLPEAEPPMYEEVGEWLATEGGA